MNSSNNKLLLIIDMQEGFRNKYSEKIINNLKHLINEFDGKVIFSNFINEKNSMFETQLDWLKFQNKQEQKLMNEFMEYKFFMHYHTGYTVLNNDLKEYLKKNEINEIYICGVYTDVCIIKTAMDLFDEKYCVYVIENCCTSLHGEDIHEKAIESLKHIIGKNHINYFI